MKTNNVYVWKEIEDLIKEDLASQESISLFAIYGSRNIEHDIDAIAIKNPFSKSSTYFQQTHETLEIINDELVLDYGKKLIRFSSFDHQEEILHLGKYKKGDLALHLIQYPSYEQMRMDWKRDLTTDVNLDILLENATYLKGSNEDLKYLKMFKRGKYDNLLQKIGDCDRTFSNFDNKLLRKTTGHLYQYIEKHIKLDKKYDEIFDEISLKEHQDVHQTTRDVIYYLADKIDAANK